MNKIRVIDLLNKIANGEEVPKRVKYKGIIFENKDGDLLNDINCSLFEHRSCGVEKLLPMLNDEVEIIEEEKKIPEKLGEYADVSGDLACDWTFGEKKLKDKINEIIDYLKSKGE